MSRYTDLEQMLMVVAQALGDDLLQQVVFVGGCATSLLITDKVTPGFAIDGGLADNLALYTGGLSGDECYWKG